jgi:uncharacterized protein
MLSVPFSEIALLAGMIAGGGVVTGVLSGLFGIGGGAVIIPVLYEAFRVLDVPDAVRMQLCLGTSLAIIVPTTIRSYAAHRAKGLALPAVVRQWSLPAVIGVGLGSIAAAFAPSVVFEAMFSLIAIVIAVKMLFGRDSWRIADTLPQGPVAALYGGIVGLCSSLMGVSGGAISNMILTLHGVPLLNAVATSAGLGVPIALAGTVGYIAAGLRWHALLPPLSVGFVSLIGVVLMAPIASAVAGLGVRIAQRLSRRTLENAFGIYMLAVAARFLAGFFW